MPTRSTTIDNNSGPDGSGDKLNYFIDVAFPTMIDLVDQNNVITSVPSSGLTFSVTALYIDKLPLGEAIATFATEPNLITVQ